MPSTTKEEGRMEGIVLFPVVKVHRQGADTSTVPCCSLEFSDNYITRSSALSSGGLGLSPLML